MNEAAQIALLDTLSSRFKHEYEEFPRRDPDIPNRYFVDNGSFESVDGEMLYCMIRSSKPRKMIEIGSGYSTLLAAQAVLANRSENPHQACELRSIDPYPSAVIGRGLPGLEEHLAIPVEEVPIETFLTLEENDILFIDSSHVVKIGGDVRYEFLEILPRLAKGVLVHIHDIFLPAEYPRTWVMQHHRFWTEQYLLHAFLVHNAAFEVMWGSSFMHLEHAALLQAAFSSYDPENRWPGSFWIRRTA